MTVQVSPKNWNMVFATTNFLCEDDFDAITAVVDADTLQNDEELNS